MSYSSFVSFCCIERNNNDNNEERKIGNEWSFSCGVSHSDHRDLGLAFRMHSKALRKTERVTYFWRAGNDSFIGVTRPSTTVTEKKEKAKGKERSELHIALKVLASVCGCEHIRNNSILASFAVLFSATSTSKVTPFRRLYNNVRPPVVDKNKLRHYLLPFLWLTANKLEILSQFHEARLHNRTWNRKTRATFPARRNSRA